MATTPTPTPFANGQLLRCDDEKYYRYLGNNKIAKYPSDTIASSYYPSFYSLNWIPENVKDVRCAPFAKEPDMKWNMNVGQKYSCDWGRVDDQKCAKNRYQYLGNNKLSCYSDWDWGRDDTAFKFTTADCTGMVMGPSSSVTDPPATYPPPPTYPPTYPPTDAPTYAPTDAPTNAPSKGLSTGAIIGIVAGSLVVVGMIVYWLYQRGKNPQSNT